MGGGFPSAISGTPSTDGSGGQFVVVDGHVVAYREGVPIHDGLFGADGHMGRDRIRAGDVFECSMITARYRDPPGGGRRRRSQGWDGLTAGGLGRRSQELRGWLLRNGFGVGALRGRVRIGARSDEEGVEEVDIGIETVAKGKRPRMRKGGAGRSRALCLRGNWLFGRRLTVVGAPHR